MSKAGRTRDELVKNFGTWPVRQSEDPHMSTTGASASTGISVAPVLSETMRASVERASSLPTSVSQASLLAENRDRWYNIGPGGSGAPTLAGTEVKESDNEV